MTFEGINLMMNHISTTIGCDYSYYTNDEAQVVKTPFLLFDYPNDNDFIADDKNFAKKTVLNIEYDSAQRDLDKEMQIEQVLADYGMVYSKTADYIDAQSAYETMYSMEVFLTNEEVENG